MIDQVRKDNFYKLNGTYNNLQDTAFGQIVHLPYTGMKEDNRSLLNRLFLFFPDKGAYEKDIFVKIEFTSKKKAVVSAYQHGQIFFTKNIRGRFKNGYFYLRPKVFLIPFFPVLYAHNFERTRFGKVGNNLIVDHTIKMWGFALFAGGSDSGVSTSIYKTEKK